MAKTKKKSNAFKKWLQNTDTVKLAKVLGTHDSTVRTWRIGRSMPRPEHMKKIVGITRGRVSYKSMVENYLNN